MALVVLAPLPPARPLGISERARLVVEILAAYGLARRELRRRPIDAVIERLRRPGSLARSSPVGAGQEAHRLGRAVGRTLARAPGDTRCLVRSLVLTRLLSRRDIESTLVIGARPEPDFLAHAWVEHEGVAVLPPGDFSCGRLVEL